MRLLILLVILLVALFGRNIVLLFAALGAVSWLDLARIVCGQTLAVKGEAYLEAARGLGASTFTVIRRHVVPNVLGPALVYATLTVPGVIIAESFLSFLGLGVQEPQTSWEVLIADGAREMRSSPWQLVFPAAMLTVTLFAFNILGDRLRDAVDAHQERSPTSPSGGARRRINWTTRKVSIKLDSGQLVELDRQWTTQSFSTSPPPGASGIGRRHHRSSGRSDCPSPFPRVPRS